MNGPGEDDTADRFREVIRRSAEEPDLRFRWLEAFVVTARHLSYDGAAAEMKSSAPRVKRAAENLERWLHSLLVIGEGNVELFAYNGVPYAELFLSVATEVLESVRVLVKHPPAAAPGGTGHPDIWLSHFTSLIAAKLAGTYQGAAIDLRLSHDQIRRKVKELERATGKKLVIGRTNIGLSPDGERVASAGLVIASRLLDEIGYIPKDYDPFVNRLRRLRPRYVARKAELAFIIRRAQAKKRLSKYDKLCVEAAREQLEQIELILEGISKLLPPATDGDIEIVLDHCVHFTEGAFDVDAGFRIQRAEFPNFRPPLPNDAALRIRDGGEN